ncbi:uncharacterized protein TNCV_1572581 [Trichonephila clavipes]|uniref:Uncharacterized protein n=1 Tax=Trichonephila clavipes TaxID=2585209 RepID=A0A8X6SUC5_TRICX|nr:uncharacterized protein TNCV_1572581 [Trichonephila clavipes]
MKAKRLTQAKQWRDKDVDFWRSVCFNDESTFEILQNKAQFVRHRRGEKFHSDCVSQTVKHPTKIMIWSVISGKGTGRGYTYDAARPVQRCLAKSLDSAAGRMVSKWRVIHFYARWSFLPYSSVYQSFFGTTKYPSVGLAG